MRREREGRQESPLYPRSLWTWLPTDTLIPAMTVSPPPKIRPKLSVIRSFFKERFNEITPVTDSVLLPHSLPFSLESATNTWPHHSDTGSDIRQGLGSSCCFFLCSWTCLLRTSEVGRSSGSYLSVTICSILMLAPQALVIGDMDCLCRWWKQADPYSCRVR